MSMRIGVIENSQFFGRTFWEFLDVIREVGIKHIQLPCRPGSTWSNGRVGRDPMYGSDELCIFPMEYADPTTLRPSLELKEKIESYGVTTTSFYHNCEWMASLTLGDTQLDIEADRIMELCDIANQWNVPVIRASEGPVERHPFGYVRLIRDFSKRRCLEQVRKALQRCIKYAEDIGVYLALENHGVLLQDADELVSMIKSIGSDYLGANVDTGNFVYAGALPEALRDYYKTIAPYTLSTHIKDVERQWDVENPPTLMQRASSWGSANRPSVWECPVGDGDAEIKFFVDELKKNSKFREIGTLNIQQESGDPRVARIDMLRRSFAYLKSIV